MNETQDYLIVTKGPRMGEKIPLSKLPIVAGREGYRFLCLICRVSHGSMPVSPRSMGGYQFEDLNSSNGTFINEVRISKPSLISNGDTIALGPDFEVRVVLVPVAEKSR